MGEEIFRVLALHDLGHATLTKRKTKGGKKKKKNKGLQEEKNNNRYSRPTLAQAASSFWQSKVLAEQQ